MIISRSSALMRMHAFPGRNLLQSKITKNFENSKKRLEGSWGYRKVPEPNSRDFKISEYVGAFVWWWITWHLVTDYEELLGYSFPDPSKWTDEELGIPPI